MSTTSSNSVEACPKCGSKQALFHRTSGRTGRNYDSCATNYGGCGWWSGEKPGDPSTQTIEAEMRRKRTNDVGAKDG